MKDPIERQAAIDAADRADYTGLAVEDVKKVTDEVVKELKQLPSAQPEPSAEDCACCVLMRKAEPCEDDDWLDKSIADLERFMTQTHIKSIAIEQEDIKQLVSWLKELRERRRLKR